MPDECCDETRQPIENIFCFHKRLKKQHKDVKIKWEDKPTSYSEELQTFIEISELPTEGRQAIVIYQQELNYVRVSIDLYQLEEDDIFRLECIKDYFLRANAGNSIFYSIEDDIVMIAGTIYTNKDCDAYIDDFIQVREDLKKHANDFINILRDIDDKCGNDEPDDDELDDDKHNQ